MSWRRKLRVVLEPGKIRDDVIGDDVPIVLPIDSGTRELVEFILKTTATEYNIPLHSILGPRRNRATVAARHAAIYLVYSWTHLTLVSIGEIFKRDHSTVHAALDKMEAAMEQADLSLIDTMLLVESRLIETYRKKE